MIPIDFKSEGWVNHQPVPLRPPLGVDAFPVPFISWSGFPSPKRPGNCISLFHLRMVEQHAWNVWKDPAAKRQTWTWDPNEVK